MERQSKGAVMAKYGNAARTPDSDEARLLLGQTEGYVEYNAAGRLIKGQEAKAIFHPSSQDIWLINNLYEADCQDHNYSQQARKSQFQNQFGRRVYKELQHPCTVEKIEMESPKLSPLCQPKLSTGNRNGSLYSYWQLAASMSPSLRPWLLTSIRRPASLLQHPLTVERLPIYIASCFVIYAGALAL